MSAEHLEAERPPLRWSLHLEPGDPTAMVLKAHHVGERMTPEDRRATVRLLRLVADELDELDRRGASAGAAQGDGVATDRAVGIDEAARVLAMTKDALYRKWRTLGLGYLDADRHVKFSLHGLQRYIARRAGKPY